DRETPSMGTADRQTPRQICSNTEIRRPQSQPQAQRASSCGSSATVMVVIAVELAEENAAFNPEYKIFEVSEVAGLYTEQAPSMPKLLRTLSGLVTKDLSFWLVV
ncbi:hypothetical protein, partial [Devosia sp. MC521]|uniref:hypothetical protein n=1 Tax=Devosia sp. MC521 TaxID=2759954 RepID=UPI001AEDA757